MCTLFFHINTAALLEAFKQLLKKKICHHVKKSATDVLPFNICLLVYNMFVLGEFISEFITKVIYLIYSLWNCRSNSGSIEVCMRPS